jgi:uracil phosphoribosyltransferase
VTPEYLQRITSKFPQVEIYALRLDRGMSSPDVLATVPGTHWEQERGLNHIDYIVPGAGGLGELINNTKE